MCLLASVRLCPCFHFPEHYDHPQHSAQKLLYLLNQNWALGMPGEILAFIEYCLQWSRKGGLSKFNLSDCLSRSSWSYTESNAALPTITCQDKTLWGFWCNFDTESFCTWVTVCKSSSSNPDCSRRAFVQDKAASLSFPARSTVPWKYGMLLLGSYCSLLVHPDDRLDRTLFAWSHLVLSLLLISISMLLASIACLAWLLDRCTGRKQPKTGALPFLSSLQGSVLKCTVLNFLNLKEALSCASASLRS